MYRTALICLFVMMSALAPAVASGSSHSAVPATERATVNDAQIEATIRAKLAKSKIGRDGFRFHVQRGVVTWEGSTNVMQHKGSATRMAKAAGAIQVINNIQVSGAAKEKAAGNLKKATVQD
ncbi:MAG: BON domain-containing protein [Acidobacteriaceae bacterium]|nr:BON domain-containing protein [Acidobacteriaceae bacterium]